MILKGVKIEKIKGDEVYLKVKKSDIDELLKVKEMCDLVDLEVRNKVLKKTSQQNKMIWEIINQIDRASNGYVSDEMAVYETLLAEANIRVEFLEIYPQDINEWRGVYRKMSPIEEYENGQVLYKCYPGTSKFNKKEMADFIEVVLLRARNEGIDVDLYEERLKKEVGGDAGAIT